MKNKTKPISLVFAGKILDQDTAMLQFYLPKTRKYYFFKPGRKSFTIGTWYKLATDSSGGMLLSTKAQINWDEKDYENEKNIERWHFLQHCAEQKTKNDNARKKADKLEHLFPELDNIVKAVSTCDYKTTMLFADAVRDHIIFSTMHKKLKGKK